MAYFSHSLVSMINMALFNLFGKKTKQMAYFNLFWNTLFIWQHWNGAFEPFKCNYHRNYIFCTFWYNHPIYAAYESIFGKQLQNRVFWPFCVRHQVNCLFCLFCDVNNINCMLSLFLGRFRKWQQLGWPTYQLHHKEEQISRSI